MKQIAPETAPHYILPLTPLGTPSEPSSVFYTSIKGKCIYPLCFLPPGKLIPRAHLQRDVIRKRRLSVHLSPDTAKAIAGYAEALNLSESSFVDFIVSSFVQQFNASGGLSSVKHSTYVDALNKRYLTMQIPSIFPSTTLVRPAYVGDTVPLYVISPDLVSVVAASKLVPASDASPSSLPSILPEEITSVEEK